VGANCGGGKYMDRAGIWRKTVGGVAEKIPEFLRLIEGGIRP